MFFQCDDLQDYENHDVNIVTFLRTLKMFYYFIDVSSFHYSKCIRGAVQLYAM